MALGLFSQRGNKKNLQRQSSEVECVSYGTLNVTVLRARTKKSRDLFSKSDFYVTLSLPAATARPRRTKTIPNNNNPEWNETFTFRVPTQVKNILEIKLLDRDRFTQDDLVTTVLLDLGTLEVGSKQTKVFTINTETQDVLEMEFELLRSKEKALEYPSNGILMAPPLSLLNITVEELQRKQFAKGCATMLKLNGAYPETYRLDPKLEEKLKFYINREMETELGLTEVKVGLNEAMMKNKKEVVLSSVPLQRLPPEHSTNLSLSLKKDTVDLHLESSERAKEQLDVRLGFDIPPQEKDFLQKRRKVVAQALQGLLGLDSGLSEDQVPTIALVASGGGARASTALLGSLKALKETGILDTITYITGVSGATWSMSALYQEEDWSHNLESIMSKNRENMTKTNRNSLAPERMKYYNTEMEEKQKQGHLVSLIDMEGLVLEQIVFGEKNTSTLSEQQKTVKDGQNPLPIYTAVNAKEAINGQIEDEWCEFTPFEVGLQKYGAFVRAEDFGSEYFLGHLIKKLPEIRLPYLIGIWSSAFSVNLCCLWRHMTGEEPRWTPAQTNIENIKEDDIASNMDTLLLNPESNIKGAFNKMFKNRPIIAEVFNFTRGLSLHQDYSSHSNFMAWKETHPDAFPNQLTPFDPTLRLIDAGHAILIGCIPVLRPERKVDLLIILSNGWSKNIFQVLEETAKYCEDHKVPFPKVDYSALEKKQEIYVFEDLDQPMAPIVVHLPLLSTSFREHKAPGEKRVSAAERAAGLVDVSSMRSPYVTSKSTYSTSDYDALINLTHYNFLNNKDTVLSSISRAVDQRRRK